MEQQVTIVLYLVLYLDHWLTRGYPPEHLASNKNHGKTHDEMGPISTGAIHPGKLTYPLKIDVWKMEFPLEWSLFWVHINFLGRNIGSVHLKTNSTYRSDDSVAFWWHFGPGPPFVTCPPLRKLWYALDIHTHQENTHQKHLRHCYICYTWLEACKTYLKNPTNIRDLHLETENNKCKANQRS